MVFYQAPHGNGSDIPMYFLKKLHVEFVLNRKPNYFDIKPSQGIGLGCPQDRLGARVDPNQPAHVPPVVHSVGSTLPTSMLSSTVVLALEGLSQLSGSLTT